MPNCLPSLTGWSPRSWLASLVLLSLASSAVADSAATDLTTLGNTQVTQVTSYSHVVTLLVVALVGLSVVVMIAFFLIGLVTKKSD